MAFHPSSSVILNPATPMVIAVLRIAMKAITTKNAA